MNSELNQFAKYQAYSSYNTKTKERNIETRNPLVYYQQNNIPIPWDSTLLQNSRPIDKELDKIVFLADSLFIPKNQQIPQNTQQQEISQNTQQQEISQNTQEQITISPDIHNQKVQYLANIKSELLDIAFTPKQPIKELYNIKTDSKKSLEQKGCQLRQSAPLSLYELRQIRDVEIQKALSTLQK